MSPPRRLLLEGRPGVGKSTVVGRLIATLREAGVPVSGFLTCEVREGRHRSGFRIETTAGEEGTLAHVGYRGRPRVGKYGVDLEEFERIALPTLEDIPEGGVVVIDELGKMELASTRFRDAVGALFEGDTPVVATVHAHRHPFTDELKRRGDVLVRRVTRGNRDALPKQILATLVGLGGRGLARPDGAVERAKGTELVDLRGRRYVDGSRRCRPSCTGHRQPR